MIALETRAATLDRLGPWLLAAVQDLFGRWQAVVTLGRSRRNARVRPHAYMDVTGRLRFAPRCTLCRRRSVTRWIHVSYEAVEAASVVRFFSRGSAAGDAGALGNPSRHTQR